MIVANGQDRGPARHVHRTLRFADEDQRLLDLLDYQDCGSTPEAWRFDHQ